MIGWVLEIPSPFERARRRQDRDPVLELAIFNGGGLAVVSCFRYRISRPEDASPPSWITYSEMQDLMSNAGLQSHRDYKLWLHGAGYPLPPGTNRESAPINGYIRLNALLKFTVFDIKIEVRDAVGDTHERVLRCRAALRDPAVFAPGVLRGVAGAKRSRAR